VDARDYVSVRLHDEYYDIEGGVGTHRRQSVTLTTGFAT